MWLTILAILISLAVGGIIGFQLSKYLAERNWLTGSEQRVILYNNLKGYGYNLGFVNGFYANEDDVDPDEEE